jgi:fumarate hydratase subunit beta
MNEKAIRFPLPNSEILKTLKAGDLVKLFGTIYTARDQAHKRLLKLLEEGKPLPFGIKNSAIYYCGPTPAREDGLFGSAGPTTSSRMDELTLPLLKAGLKAAIGKGGRHEKILRAFQEYGAVYFTTFGGAGAYLAKKIKSQKLIAFPDLGAEAIYELEVEDFPVIAAGNA